MKKDIVLAFKKLPAKVPGHEKLQMATACRIPIPLWYCRNGVWGPVRHQHQVPSVMSVSSVWKTACLKKYPASQAVHQGYTGTLCFRRKPTLARGSCTYVSDWGRSEVCMSSPPQWLHPSPEGGHELRPLLCATKLRLTLSGVSGEPVQERTPPLACMASP